MKIDLVTVFVWFFALAAGIAFWVGVYIGLIGLFKQGGM